MKRTTARILRSQKQIAKALATVIKSQEDASEVAFHLADIRHELCEIDGILARGEKTGRITKRDIGRIYQCLCIHWMYHARELDCILQRISSNGENADEKCRGNRSLSKGTRSTIGKMK